MTTPPGTQVRRDGVQWLTDTLGRIFGYRDDRGIDRMVPHIDDTGNLVDGTGMALSVGGGAPSAFTSRALTAADSGVNEICASAQTATVNTGLGVGFGCSFKGTISFAGTATVNDVRTTGAANPWCALMQTGTDAYDVVGGKA